MDLPFKMCQILGDFDRQLIKASVDKYHFVSNVNPLLGAGVYES